MLDNRNYKVGHLTTEMINNSDWQKKQLSISDN